jgi:hypothetical protein
MDCMDTRVAIVTGGAGVLADARCDPARIATTVVGILC